MAKFKNTIGAEFPKYVSTQLSKRAEITEKKNRSSTKKSCKCVGF